MNISGNGKNLIKQFEELSLKAYFCPTGVWTIGYGHTLNVKRMDFISEQEADCLFMQDLYKVEQSIKKLVKVPLTQNQCDALCSFIFNVGGWGI
ncbi:lysozyme [Utexia brackfieldae]|uniref:lysozyme n=1 Tax=Utexia brackfieldae TaxID=3074108 RepID=UPI00370DC7CC